MKQRRGFVVPVTLIAIVLSVGCSDSMNSGEDVPRHPRSDTAASSDRASADVPAVDASPGPPDLLPSAPDARPDATLPPPSDAAADGGANLPPTDPAALMTTLTDLAALGQKRVGTPAGTQAGAYVKSRMEQLGLSNVHYEGFSFPRFDVQSATVALTINGQAATPPVGFDVFEASGSGHADGDVISVGNGTDMDLLGVDLTGKIALVNRVQSYHRSTQYRNIVAKGGLAMLYVSEAPDNLRQVGSVSRQFEALGAIPAITIGQTDGDALHAALTAGQPVHAVIDVVAVSTPATGQNVVGIIPGREEGQIIIGAHYDTWFTGSTDNGGGIAAVLALAARRMAQSHPRYTLVFVGYDGEEVALYGGYDYLRKHKVLANDPILAVVNFEIPSSANSDLLGLAHSNHEVLDQALKAAGLPTLYTTYVSLDLVPNLFGGIIPTDIQGIYRSGVPTLSTACDSAYYHTTEDTPDKVDIDFLASAVDDFDVALENLLGMAAADFASMRDPVLWVATTVAQPRTTGQPLTVDVTITDANGVAQAGAPVEAILLYDDFFQADLQDAMTDASGKYTFSFDASLVDQGQGARFVHVNSGPTYPLVESVVAVP